MLHAKFQDHRTSGSGEEDFLRFLPYMGMAAILAVSEEKTFENCGRRQQQRQRTPEHGYTISSPMSLQLR